jgi:hypothetical protein
VKGNDPSVTGFVTGFGPKLLNSVFLLKDFNAEIRLSKKAVVICG